MTVTRRRFLHKSMLACAGASVFTTFIPRVTGPITSSDRHNRLVIIFLRGGADGLNMVVPHGEAAYYAMRPSINIPKSAVLDLDGFFGLHPAMSGLKPLWNGGQLAIVHAAGSPNSCRMHFEAQDFLESGITGVRDAGSGWMGRVNRGRTVIHSPGENFHNTVMRLSQFIRDNPQTQMLSSEVGGWDHHSGQGSSQGSMTPLLETFSQTLTSFWGDLGALRETTVVITVSEFGRSLRENNRGGTDHGHGNVMFVLGAKVKGKKVYGDWPGLAVSQLHEGRDLAVTTDYRRVLGEIVHRHLGDKELDNIFPGFDNDPANFLNLLG